MIKRVLNIDYYWKVIVYYNINYNLFSIIIKDLKSIKCNKTEIKNIYNKLYKGYAKAVTISNADYKTSIVLFNNHKNINDYVNSIVHEAEHIKQSMLDYYNIKDKGEEPAYTIGYLSMKLLEIFI